MISVTLVLVVITVIVSLMGFNNPVLTSKLLHNPYLVNRNKEYYRLITSGFVHKDMMHLGFNMFALYMFGEVVEIYFLKTYGINVGRLIFMLMYILTIIISDLPSYFKYKEMPAYSSLGASGGVSAIVFASILLMPLGGIGILFIPGFQLPAFLLGLLYLIYSYHQDKQSSGNINHSAHLWGAIAGFVLTAVLIPSAIPDFLSQLAEFDIREWKFMR